MADDPSGTVSRGKSVVWALCVKLTPRFRIPIVVLFAGYRGVPSAEPEVDGATSKSAPGKAVAYTLNIGPVAFFPVADVRHGVLVSENRTTFLLVYLRPEPLEFTHEDVRHIINKAG